MSRSLRIQRLLHAGDLPLPRYETAGAAGMDLMAANPADEPVVLAPMERKLVPTGLVLQLEPGYEAQVRPRSGLAFKHGVTVLNAPGTIDADYRGEVQVLLVNLGAEPFTVTRGMRIAQMVVAPVTMVELMQVDAVDDTALTPDTQEDPVKQHLVEFVHVRVQEGQEEEFLASRPGAVAAVAAAIPGFVAAPVIAKGEDGTWTDVWVYETPEAAEGANHDAENVPAFLALVELQRDVTVEVTTGPADGDDPLAS